MKKVLTFSKHQLGWIYLKNANIKTKKKLTSVDKDVEKLEWLYITGGNVTSLASIENSTALPQKSRELPNDPTIPLQGIYI